MPLPSAMTFPRILPPPILSRKKRHMPPSTTARHTQSERRTRSLRIIQEKKAT